jgi:natural product biosynthesis luciferase-like monooxygenase protein/amino acid adenylation domain-containing protein/FkbM family methyltransferase
MMTEEVFVIPTSFAQQRLWFLDQLEPGTPVYNIPTAMRLEGCLQLSVLERSLNEVVRRHESLRTRFAAVDGEPVQVIAPAVKLALPLLDLQHLDPAAREERVRELAGEEARRGFDLKAGQLLRGTVLRLSAEEHVLLVTLHHIIADAWSVGVLVREVAALYEAYARGEESPLPELSVQYADYVIWQREWLAGNVLERQLAYWKGQLEGAPTVLELPSEKARPAVRSSGGARYPIVFSAELTAALKRLSQSEGATLFMTLMAAFNVLLYRHTGRRDILVGTPIAGRTRPEIKALIGFFVNTLVLRTDLAGNPTFRELLARVRSVALEAYEHQELPFERLVEELQPARNLGSTPLFQVMLALNNVPREQFQLSGLRLSQIEVENETAKFDLSLLLEERGETLAGSLVYNTDCLSRTTISGLARHLERLLTAVVSNSDRHISELPLLTKSEERQILVEWNETQRAYPNTFCLHQLFEAQVERTPEALALQFEAHCLSYRELNGRANRLAHYLRRMGVGPGSRVGLCAERSLEIVVGLLGILKGGAAYVPLDASYPAERLAFMLQDARVTVLLTQQRLVESLLVSNARIFCLDSDWEALAEESEDNPVNYTLPENLVYIVYTSGSTGRPKGVSVEHRQLFNYVNAIQERLNLTSRASFALVSTLAADLGNTAIYPALCFGGLLHVLSRERISDPAALADYFDRHSIDCLKIVPSHLAALLASAQAQKILPRRRLILGGESADWNLIDKIQTLAPECVIVNHYGPTEATIGVLTCQIESDRHDYPAQGPPLGRPIANTRVYILDEYYGPVPVGVIGELFIGGAGVARGYLDQPDQTGEKFIPDSFSEEAGARLYRTGDLARYLPDGNVEFLGRRDHQVKVRGFRIELGDLETTLLSHSLVREAVVLVRDDRPGEKTVVAYIVPQRGENADLTTQLRDFMKAKLPEYMLPSGFVLLEALPLTANGKIDRQALAALNRNAAPGGQSFLAPRDAIEELIAGIWSKLINVDVVGIHDNFFELGGHSLLATQVISRLREAFRVEIGLNALFESPTVAGLAEHVAAAMGAGKAPTSLPLVPISRDGEAPLAYAQQRLWFLDQLQPGSSFYNLPGAVRITGPLDVSSLERGLNEIIRRHEVLRTVFAGVGGKPVQVVAPSLKLPLVVTDLRHLTEPERSAEARRLTTQEAQRPFDLSQGPLLRVVLLRFSEQEHVVVVTLHHIVADGWSIGIFIRELTALYEAFSQERLSPLPEINVQYADYAMWQQQCLEGNVLERDIAYWKQQLEGSPALLVLPTDRPRRAVQRYRGVLHSFTLDSALAAELKALSKREGVTLFMTLLTGFKVLLSRYSGQCDIVVGTPIAGRSHAATEALIGLFINPLVLRTDLSGDPSVRALLARVRQVALAAYTHQNVPFEKLVEELDPERSLSHAPLFQVMFTLDNTPQEVLALSGLKIEREKIASGTTKYDLTFSFEDDGQELRGAVEYNTDLFDGDTVIRMVRHYERLLESMVQEPERRISAMAMMGENERQQMINEWNDTERVSPPSLCLHQLFEAQAARTPDATALIFEKRSLSYRELNEQADLLAHFLRQVGVRAEKRVALCVERSLEMVVGLLGILKAGGAYVPLDPTYPPERLSFMLQDAGVTVLLTQQRLVEALPSQGAPVICLDTDWEKLRHASENKASGSISSENLAYVIYTSGSTGQPKGVTVSHQNVINFFVGMDERVGEGQPGTLLALTSISFDISVLEIFWALTRGFRVIIQREQPRSLPTLRLDDEIEEKSMDFSLFYFASDEEKQDTDIYELLIEGARFADQHGFSAVWTPERHFHAFGGLYPNPSLTSAALATVTKHIQLRAGSVVLPLHDPLRVAEEWSVVDNLSRGRVAISFASGWHANDFVFAPEAYNQRHEVMYRDIEIVRRLWRGESILRQDGAGKEIEVRIRPRPIQTELPFWITAAGSPATFQSAGRMGANLLTHLLGQTVGELEEKIKLYRTAWQEHGHGPGVGHVTLMLHTFVAGNLEFVREKVREPFTNYLRSSINLLRHSARSLGRDIESQAFTAEDMQAVLAHAFDRYFETSALLGTPETCLDMIGQLKAAGVDEVACLIDFGVEQEAVLSSLRDLNDLKERSNARKIKGGEDYSEDYSIAAQINRYGVTHLQCTPSMARMLSLEPEALDAFRKVRNLMIGGEAFPVSLANQLRESFPGKLHNMYGPTETTIWSTTFAIEKVQPTVPIGKPIANTDVRILDRQLEPVPIGVPGELLIGGAGVVRGYLNGPALTAERFIPDPFAHEPGARLYRTGDQARYLPDGNIEFLGRLDQQVKIRGHRIEPGEIESALARYPGVRETVVVAREDETEEKRLVAYIVAHEIPAAPPPPYQLGGAEAERLLAKHPHFKLPNGLIMAHLSGYRANVVYREIFENEVYLKHGITLNDGDCVFDVGANMGFFTLFANQKRKDLTLYAFEPIPPTFEVLQTNVALHGLNVKLFNCGVSNTRDTAAFTFYPQMPGLSGRYSDPVQDKRITQSIISGYLRKDGSDQERAILTRAELEQVMEEQFQSETYICQLDTLSDIIRENKVERIDLLKIDVEKSEFDVLSGIREEDWRKIRQIVMEVDTSHLLTQVTALLDRQDFDFIVEEIVSVEESVADQDVHVYMLYATQRGMNGRSVSKTLPETAVQPLAYANDNGLSPNRIRAYLKDRLPEYMIPSAFVFLNELPLTPNGKVNLRALPPPTAPAPRLDADYVPPQTRTEETIAAIWREVIKIDRVGLHDNFFEAGGTSLLVVQVNSKLREAFNRPIPVVEMFRHPTINSLARYLDEEQPQQPSFERAQTRASKQAEAMNAQRRMMRAGSAAKNRGR